MRTPAGWHFPAKVCMSAATQTIICGICPKQDQAVKPESVSCQSLSKTKTGQKHILDQPFISNPSCDESNTYTSQGTNNLFNKLARRKTESFLFLHVPALKTKS